MGEEKNVVVVAGDVCIDWLAVPVEASAAPAEANWRLQGGDHMFAARGGAWLTCDMLTAALPSAEVIGTSPRDHLESIPPDEVIHSLLRLRPALRDKVWRVGRYDGFAGPLESNRSAGVFTLPPLPRPPCLVLLDDAGNGFREHDEAWSKALEGTPIVVHKCRRPLMQKRLWEQLAERHARRTIGLVTADDLRSTGANISRGLSWERTAFETWVALAQQSEFAQLRRCRWIVVTFGLEGALAVATTQDHRLDTAELWFCPDSMEGERLLSTDGSMTGLGSAFAAGLAQTLVTEGGLDAKAINNGVKQGLGAAVSVLRSGFGAVDSAGLTKGPTYVAACAAVGKVDDTAMRLCQVPLPALRATTSAADIEKQRTWRIIDQVRAKPFEQLARDVLENGLKALLNQMPFAAFEKFTTIDRTEIESYRSVRDLMLEYVRRPAVDRPLCLAVFGTPGAGKSFGVKQLAAAIAKTRTETKFEVDEFNVSQWRSPTDLVEALHRVRDHAISGKVPLAIFDEFDTGVDGAKLGWLRYFLAPMHDGVFFDGPARHQVGRAIFVFAGGTSHSFEQFTRDHGDNRDAKAPDFLSRLRGHINVAGVGAPWNTNLIRRAIVLRAALSKHPALFNQHGRLRIQQQVATAFLTVPRFRHGARSIEAVVEMSRLVGCTEFEAASLPPKPQLEEHVEAESFLRALTQPAGLDKKLEAVATAIHEDYLRTQLADGKQMGSRPALRAWSELDKLFQNSNREQAADYPRKLAAIGCTLVDKASLPAGEAPFAFGKMGQVDEVELLAEREHERWVEERGIVEPWHPALQPWSELPESEKNKDRAAIRAMPGILAGVGLAIRRPS